MFDALESIRMHAHINGDKELANIVQTLGEGTEVSFVIHKEAELDV